METLNSSSNNRPRRKAADNARKKIQAAVNVVTKPKPLFKHGWLENDQNFEDDIVFQPIWHHSSSSDLESDLSCTNESLSTLTDNGSEDSSTSPTSEDDLLWDTTPDQYLLTSNRPNLPDAWSSTPFTTKHGPPVIPPAFPRNRTNAFSQPSLVRNNAFRLPPHNQAFYSTPEEPTHFNQNPPESHYLPHLRK